MAQQWEFKRGRDVVPGDALEFLGKYYTVDRIEPHSGIPEARIAYSGPRWGMTIFNDDPVRVLAITKQS